MAKLNFRYGAMNSGKTTILIQTAYNYEERDQNVIVIKPKLDTKGDDYIVSRIGAKRKVDELIGDYVGIAISNKYFNHIDIDEPDFIFKSHHAGLTKEEITVPLIIVNK